MSENTLEMSGINEIQTLLNSRRKALLVETYEEERFLEDMKALAELKSFEIYSWSITGGGIDLLSEEVIFKDYDPISFIRKITAHDKPSIFILKDIHDLWSNPQARRAMRDYLESKSSVYKPIICTSPQISIPIELEKSITTVRYDLPSRKDVIELLEGMEKFLESKELPTPEGRERDAIIHALVGMTRTEINNVLKKSATKNKRILLDEIVAEKEQVIRKTGLLEYITKLGNMDNVGGMDIFKEWLNDAYFAFDPEARDYNIDPARGAITVGVPGSGKSLMAKSLAHLWNLPLLKMNMSSIMDSKVGQSEKNIDRALKLAEDVSPCVLWIDELEKGLSGVGSSDKSDGGTLSRVVQSLLTWLSDKEAPVFVIATANDISKLPPELTRAGRFDEFFFVSIPSEEEREDILEIHLRKRGYNISENKDENTFDSKQIKRVAKLMENFTGAEIERVVAEAGRRAYAGYKKNLRESYQMTEKDLVEQTELVIPIVQRNPEILRDLREWAKQSAKCASSYEHEIIHGKPIKIEKKKGEVNPTELLFDFN